MFVVPINYLCLRIKGYLILVFVSDFTKRGTKENKLKSEKLYLKVFFCCQKSDLGGDDCASLSNRGCWHKFYQADY